MKKGFFVLFSVAFLTVIVAPAFAAKMFITTIRETTVKEVQDVAIEVMTGKNFTIDEADNFKIVFTKDFGDGFWAATHHCLVKFNFLERDGNVRVTLTETEILQGMMHRARSIDPLIPYIKEIRNKIDGTPVDQIENEAVNQLPGSGNSRQKVLGIVLGQKNEKGFIVIDRIEPGSLAADAKLVKGDLIIEVNGRSTREFEVSTLSTYLANKAAEGSSILVLYERDGKQEMVTLKQAD